MVCPSRFQRPFVAALQRALRETAIGEVRSSTEQCSWCCAIHRFHARPQLCTDVSECSTAGILCECGQGSHCEDHPAAVLRRQKHGHRRACPICEREQGEAADAADNGNVPSLGCTCVQSDPAHEYARCASPPLLIAQYLQVLKPGLDPGAARVFLEFLSYSSGPLPEEQFAKVKVGKATSVQCAWCE